MATLRRAAAGVAFLLCASLHATDAIDFAPIESPNLDLSGLGRVALAGDFDAISVYSYQGQNENAFTTNGSQSLWTQLPNGAFDALVTADASIVTMCPFVRRTGELFGIVVGGNFTSIGGQQAQGAALFDPSKNSITPLPGLNGSVSALFCDQERDSVYVGGNFKGGSSTNAIAWVGTTGWANLPFAGFNGPVNAIAKAPDGNVVFAGSFSGLANTTVPTTRDQQVVNLSSGNVTSAQGSVRPGFEDPSNVVCNGGQAEGAGKTWLLYDQTPGYWRINQDFGYEPTKLRIYNTHFEGRGTKTFRFTAFPINGIMNMTYRDPQTNETRACDATCHLSDDPSIPYQDFHFVNVIGMNGFQLDVSEWYGEGGGFNGIELFQDDIYAYAVSDLNEPQCSGADFPSNSTSTGPWQVTASGTSSAQFLTADIQGPDVNSGSASVVFYPDIKQSGNYSVTMYTPGCHEPQDDVCDRRGIANVTARFRSDGTVGPSSQIFQTNYFDKYDQIYHGYIDASSSTFRPSVTLAPLDSQNSSISLVALRVRFELLDATSQGLNGIYEFDPDMAVAQTDFARSAYDAAGMNLSTGADVITLSVVGETTYVGGDFESNGTKNVFSITSGEVSPLPAGGLNSPVTTMLAFNNILYIGGNFTGTATGGNAGLNNVAAFDTGQRKWLSLGAGVNGAVLSIVPLELNLTSGQPETCITINGDFTRILGNGNVPGYDASGGLAIWVPSRNDWLNSLNVDMMALEGQLTYSVNVTGGSPILAGAIMSQGLAISGAVQLSTSDGNATLSSLGIRIQPRDNQPSMAKRAIPSASIAGVATGLFNTDDGRNLTVLGGHFTSTASDGSSIHNVAILNSTQDGSDTTVSGIGGGVAQDSTVRAVAVDSNSLYIGGSISGKAAGTDLGGFAVWDLGAANFASPQPPALTADSGDGVVVNAISVQPDSSNVYVGGVFDGSGNFACPGLCVYNDSSWHRPGSGFQGQISVLLWQGGSTLLVGGNLTIARNASSLASYDASGQTWTTLSNSTNVPGPVTAITAANGDASQYWVAGSSINGSAFIVKYDGSNFIPVGDIFAPSTVIRGLSMLSLSQGHDNTDLVDSGMVLLVTGSLNLPSFGNVSAALFNGTSFSPFILSTSGNQPGSISQLIAQTPQSFSGQSGHMAVGFVVLIALAIAFGLIMLLVVAGVIVERQRRRREGYRPAPQNYFEKTNLGRIPPEHLFGNLGSDSPTGPRV